MKPNIISKGLFYSILIIFMTPVFGKPISDGECHLDLETAIVLQKNDPSDADIKKSYDALLCLAQKGESEAKHELFLTFYGSYPVLAEKGEEAFSFLVEAARSGDVDAQYNMGYLYYEGELVEKDEELAMEWLTFASDNGSAEAAYLLGNQYTLLAKAEHDQENFDEKKKLYNQSIHYLDLAVKKGHVQATSMLGVTLLATGDSETKIQRGLSLLKEAAAQGDIDSMLYLGDAYEAMSEALNDEEMRKVSADWYKKAAKLGKVHKQKK